MTKNLITAPAGNWTPVVQPVLLSFHCYIQYIYIYIYKGYQEVGTEGNDRQK